MSNGCNRMSSVKLSGSRSVENSKYTAKYFQHSVVKDIVTHPTTVVYAKVFAKYLKFETYSKSGIFHLTLSNSAFKMKDCTQ